MLRPIYCLALVLSAGGALLAADEAPVPWCNVVPGWTQAGPTRAYESSNLFEYMDGDAEVRHFAGRRGFRGPQ